MDSDFFSYFIPTSPTGLLTWLVPFGYLVLCITSRALRKRREAVVPGDVDASPIPPSIHPILLGALEHRGAPGSASRRGAIESAVAGIIKLIGSGQLQLHVATAHHTAGRRPTVLEENESPIQTGGDARRRIFGPQSAERKQAYDLFGEDMSLERTAQGDASIQPFEVDALSFFLPQGTAALSLAEICLHSERLDYMGKRFENFVGDQFPALEASGLTHPASLLERILRGPLAVVLVFWCMFVMSGSAGAGSGVVGMLIIMISTGALLSGAPMLTDAGARVLAEAQANVRWAAAVVRERRNARETLQANQLAGLFASLTAQGYVELAADLFEVLGQAGGAGGGAASGGADGSGAGGSAGGSSSQEHQRDSMRQVGAFFTRQPFFDGSRELNISPAELIIRLVRRTVESIED